MSLRRYSREELQRFFEALDECLEEPARVVLVGGSAIILAYGVTTTTVDIDTFNAAGKSLMRAVALVYERTGLTPPLAPAGVAQAPEGFEERLIRHDTGGRFLELYVLEKHDLAISKALRGDERDMQHIEALHREAPLDCEVLVGRFVNEMLPVYVGDPAPVTDYFLWIVEELFGELELAKAERILKPKKKPTS